VLSPGGSVYILGQILDDDMVRPLGPALMNLVFLSFYEHGRSLPERQYRALLASAGFVAVERRLTGSGLNLMMAKVPDATIGP
jgi:hypothetical protein